jgi:TcpE family
LELPTYTNIWRIEKRLYKLYDFRLPMPLPIGQIAVFAAIAVPYVVILKVIGLPFSHTLLWLYILPPAALAWLITRPVLEGKRLPELVVSQVRYLGEPRTWCRMAPLTEKEEITVVARVWRRPDLELVGVEATEPGSVEAAGVEAAGLTGVEVTEAVGVEMTELTEAAGVEAAEEPAGQTAELVGVGAGELVGVEAAEAAVIEAADDQTAASRQPAAAATSEVPDTPPPPVEHRPGRSALVRHLPTGPIPAWPKAPSRASRLSGRPARPVPAPPPRETSRPSARAVSPPSGRDMPAPPVRDIPAAPVRDIPGPPASPAPAPSVREVPQRPEQAVRATPVPPSAPALSVASAPPAPPAPPARDAQAPAARMVSAPGAPPASPPRSRPVVTVTGDQYAERPIRMVERALSNPAQRRAAGWRDRVVVVPGGHRPGQPDQMQRDRTRARLPLPGGHRVVVLGCTVGAGQTVTVLLTGELLVSLRDDQVAVLDLNPGPGSLAQRARAVPALTEPRPPAPSRLEVVTREAITREPGAPGARDPEDDPEDVTKIFELLSARYPLTLADPGAAVVPRVLAAASQLILVSPASRDAASALATTREWLEAHGHAGLAEGAIIVLNGVSRHTLPHVEQAEALARGRCRAIVRVPWDDHLKNPDPQRAGPSGPGARPARVTGPLSPAALQAYTALAGVLVASLASVSDELRARP